MTDPTAPANVLAEANRRYPPDHEVPDPFGATGVARSDLYGYDECANRAFCEGAVWARKQALCDVHNELVRQDAFTERTLRVVEGMLAETKETTQ